LDSSITKAVVHVSYEPKQEDVKTESTKKSSDSIVVEKTKTHKESVDKINIIVDQILKNENIVDEFIENINENNSKVTSTLVNPGESSLSPRLNR